MNNKFPLSENSDCAKLVWDINNQPQSQQFDDIYFSRLSGLEESRFVFLENNQLLSRWRKLKDNSTFLIVETGFGTGLNFLATWQLWNEFIGQSQTNAHLHFYSVEKHPLTKRDLTRALSLWPELSALAENLLNAYPPPNIAGIHKLVFHNITLNLFIGDAVDGLKNLLPDEVAGPQVKQCNVSTGRNRPVADAWYLDGFAPAKNPEMWRPELFQYMSRISKAGTTFATFTCAGEVRRGLQYAGFLCKKIKGFGKKREMLVGEFKEENHTHEAFSSNKRSSSRKKYISWHLLESRLTKTKCESAIIIGGGLAACHLASALEKRGLSVRILEKENSLAAGASGNCRGILYTRLSPHQDVLSRFNLSALLYACRFYENNKLFSKAGRQCGVLHLATNKKEQEYYRSLAQRFTEQPDFLRWLSADESTLVSGIKLQHDGLFLPKAGWLDPVKVCQQLSSHKNIQVLSNTRVETFYQDNAQWLVDITRVNTKRANNNNDDNEKASTTINADLLIIANAYDATSFIQTAHLPLKKIRGQVSYLENSPNSAAPWPELSIAICGDGYVAPLGKRGLCIGASFNLRNMSLALDPQDHVENLQRLGSLSSEFADLQKTISPDEIEGRAGIRCTTPDYFPVVGPIPQADAFVDRFRPLSKKASANIDACGVYHPNLFCLTGLGSRGLAYAPIVADALASTITGEPFPFDLETWLHLHPARFLVRNLIRNQAIPGLN